MDSKLREVQEWAQAKIDAGQEPPWAWYLYMKLVETIKAIRAGRAATKPFQIDDETQFPM